MKDYASREGHSKVVNQLSMQKMSMMARSRSQENVLDESNQIDETQAKEKNDISNNQKNVVAQIIILEKQDKKTNIEDQNNQNEIEDVSSNSTATNDNELETNKIADITEIQNEIENVTLDCKTINVDELKVALINNKNNKTAKENKTLNSPLDNEKEVKNTVLELNNEITEKNKLITEDKNISVAQIKDEESVSQCTMPPPMDPPRSWDFIQTSIMHTSEINELVEKETQESIKLIPDPIVCSVNTDDSELEWGSDESLPTDPNQSGPVLDDTKEEKKGNKFYNFITSKLMNKNKNRVSASADSIIDGTTTTTNKHTRNKSFSSLSTFKLTMPSDVNKALYQLSPEMNFAHSSFSKSKSFNERISIENSDKNCLEFERSKSMCLELKQNFDTSENQQRDSDSQSDDSSLRSKRSLLLSMRMPKVHDEHHDDYHLEVKDNETSDDEGPHYWYSPNKKNDKIVQQDTVIRNNSDSEESE